MVIRTLDRESAWEVAAGVPDPELPMVTLADLGILRSVECTTLAEGGYRATVTITPTYSGCPAMREISVDLHRRLSEAGFAAVVVRTSLAPPWSSDWISPAGREKLAAVGVAPPNPSVPRGGAAVPLTLTTRPRSVGCPHCGSTQTRETAPFGATACRALYRCLSCDEPFEYVKEI
ncbi:ring-1,2-phenylacetyl-CoA epoxidase subunit PaaD [Jatrophihabitans sp. GAS493]|uniref:1,2-phenylacetyl-CoA epoxidase subunit PaaD n=1 Tax=Jatrophihabitans sp. GAS493 TaxID=1907575 RepID=UPI000BB7DC93|nr:1,2-phenylacetyl-CoA epoxidase subunit PaaD [Jatrophihabitans sp. GAS493]SOD72808.1 ring-1,2-phenylacetyl-CoA epoxidase subunit PaaD [Jatrophihabitans sp. GAS493]